MRPICSCEHLRNAVQKSRDCVQLIVPFDEPSPKRGGGIITIESTEENTWKSNSGVPEIDGDRYVGRVLGNGYWRVELGIVGLFNSTGSGDIW